jgi:NADH-quinone oxidoreductase subunit A
MAQEYVPIAILAVFSVGFAFLIVAAGHLFGPRRPTLRKGEPYESGIVPYGPGRRRVPVQFYLVAVLFILFDIEIVFFLPWAVVLRDLRWAGLAEMAVFVGILLVGYAYAWKTGALDWE